MQIFHVGPAKLKWPAGYVGTTAEAGDANADFPIDMD